MLQSEIAEGKLYAGPAGAPKRLRSVTSIEAERYTGRLVVAYRSGGRYGFCALRTFAAWADHEVEAAPAGQ